MIKINAQMDILRAKKRHSQKMATSLEQVNLGVSPKQRRT